MKQFVVGSALLMFVWSLPTRATNDHHTISLEPNAGVHKAAFEQFFGDTLPPMGYVQFCELHKSDCRPSGTFADRIQLTDRKFAELTNVNNQVNTTVVPMSDLEHLRQDRLVDLPSRQQRRLRGLRAGETSSANRAWLARKHPLDHCRARRKQ